MDGFAVTSMLTTGASAEHPVKFRVAGSIAAGADVHDSQSLGIDHKSPVVIGHPCVEIMTGACFPEQQFPQLDAVVKVEDVELVEDGEPDRKPAVKYILVSAPVKMHQHRRPAGTDFLVGDLVIAKGTRIEPKHVMALTSVGVKKISVTIDSTSTVSTNGLESGCSLNIGVLPTGSELLDLFHLRSGDATNNGCGQRFPDSNGPYVTSAVRSMSSSYEVEYAGPCPDDEHNLVEAFRSAVEVQQYDVLVTTGGVSMGRFDLVRKVIESHFDAEIVFHGCTVRPGAPVLFASISSRNDSRCESRHGVTTLIGAPGNPLAAAMTVRFFLKPFLRMLQAPKSLSTNELVQMTLLESLKVETRILNQGGLRRKPAKAVAFLLAKHPELENKDEPARPYVELLQDQASYKIKPLLQADCWVTAPAGSESILHGDQAQSYSLW